MAKYILVEMDRYNLVQPTITQFEVDSIEKVLYSIVDRDEQKVTVVEECPTSPGNGEVYLSKDGKWAGMNSDESAFTIKEIL